MANSSNRVPKHRVTNYGTEYTCWCKEKTNKNGKSYLEGYLFFGDKGIRITRYSGVSTTDRKGDTVFPIGVTVFKAVKREALTM